MALVHASIAEIPEASLVERLMADSRWRSNLLGIRGIPADAIVSQRVPLAGALPGAEGDVDLLLCSPGQPELATAIEVKRIKVGSAAFGPGRRPNKLLELEKGKRQANLLARIGFSQVYLYALVVVDSRENNAGQISHAGPTSELRKLIWEAISPKGLDQRVGLMKFEFVQPMDHPAFTIGTFHAKLLRSTETVRQTAELTAWVAQVMDEAEWDRSFQKTQRQLVAHARQAKREIAEGQAKPLDYDQL